jgi:hypothetical protein
MERHILPRNAETVRFSIVLCNPIQFIVTERHILQNAYAGTNTEHDNPHKRQGKIHRYHPNAQKPGAEAMASKNLGKFLNDIETCLKSK